MDRSEAVARLTTSRLAHLATTRADGSPHIVPVTFAISGETVVTAIDHKPKSNRRLQRLVNIESNPRVALMADHYEEDWTRLWWVRVDGEAIILAAHRQGMDALTAKYEQYAAQTPDGPLIAFDIERVSWWASTP